jgi:hypothetical protein
MATATAPAHRDAPAEETPTLKRDFTLWSAFSLAFAYISPIVATYGVFALALPLVGPGYWLLIPIAVAGQLLVALVLGEVASPHPLEGSLYAWAGRLLGPAYGWFTGWAYMWTVLIALVTVAVGAVAPDRRRRARLGGVRDRQRRLAARDRQRSRLVPAVGGGARRGAARGDRLGRLRRRPEPDRPVRGALMYEWPRVDEAALLADRRARVADVMRDERLDALLLSGFDNIRYATGFRASLTYDSNYEWYAAQGMIVCIEPSTAVEVDGEVVGLKEEEQYVVTAAGLRQLTKTGVQ